MSAHRRKADRQPDSIIGAEWALLLARIMTLWNVAQKKSAEDGMPAEMRAGTFAGPHARRST